jgi:hypothetical protein
MHRKAEEVAARSANGDDDNAARRRPGPSVAAEYLGARPLVRVGRGPANRRAKLAGTLSRPVSARASS